MKKLGHLLVLFVALLMSMTLVFVTACKSCGDNKDDEDVTPEVTKTLQSITVDTSAAKTYFIIGDAFTSEGVKVTAHFKGSDESTSDEDVTSQAYIDSRAFDGGKQGNYTIEVTYSYESETARASYMVNVNFEKDGVDVILKDSVMVTADTGFTLVKEKDEGDVYLSATVQKVEIDPTQVEVRIPDSLGNVDYSAAPVSADQYDVAVYKDDATEPLTAYNNLGAGVYQIWVTLKNKTEFIPDNFASVYVNDTLTEFARNSEAGTTTQTAGINKITKDWTYTATYISGATATKTAADVSVDINTLTAGTVQATVSYTDLDFRGKATKKDTTVECNITASTDWTELKYEYIPTGSLDSGTVLTDEDNAIEISGYGATGPVYNSEYSMVYSDDFEGQGGVQVSGNTGNGIKIHVYGISQIKVWYYGGSSKELSADLALYTAKSDNTPNNFDQAAQRGKEKDGTITPAVFTTTGAGTYFLFRQGSASCNIQKVEVITVLPPSNTELKTWLVTFADSYNYSTSAVNLKHRVMEREGYNVANEFTPIRKDDGSNTYTFTGWYNTASGDDVSNKFDFTQTITADTSIYAHWTTSPKAA